MNNPKRFSLNMVISLIWAVAVVLCYTSFLHYEGKPAITLAHPQNWPAESSIERAAGEKNLVVFIHPKCPCTSATLTELKILMTRCPDLRATAVFLKPDGVEANWEKTAYWQRADEIRNVSVISDNGNVETNRFNATTSGETLVYDEVGELVFAGGITGSRGHEGDNQGLSSIVGIVRDGDLRCSRTGVFGCALRNPNEQPEEIGRTE